MSLTLNKLGVSLWRKWVKRIKNEKKSVVWMQGSRDGPAGKWFPPRHAMEDIARGATRDRYIILQRKTIKLEEEPNT
ncbi:hypothetical protein HanXRQr2_Chr04g0156781 [Helianthus annuus]|uniref:Uncharacterized protein n=1 Tax=Helianthus annuus TaxID=4232 RepID=A0A251V0J1_HELAN|nr:uncharacterized protein LOC110936474 isoform X3 [Helianthus annuus]KAF5809405.1 hypothetical protein HanXRQr2_Chr04g0156781 [Helianthus annuus]KAJ0587939.1 hypothetical protein HanIR_Chr04g0168901 [Helianthus annuus]KAJ0930569.1 hypothetical protein HanPSC8_Chr04g0150851 [Helianthus annuus]